MSDAQIDAIVATEMADIDAEWEKIAPVWAEQYAPALATV